MERISAVMCALALPVAILVATPGAGEPKGAEPSKAAVPGYIEAERAPADQMLGPKLTDEVFSDRYTPLRNRLVADSLRANPASGCARPPAFALETVAPLQATKEGSAWLERYVIKCKEDVRRTFLLLSAKDGIKSAEFAPGGTIADPTLQRDVLQGVMAATIGKAPASCKGVKVRDTRVKSMTRMSEPWTEVWSLDACGTPIDVDVSFTPSPRGGTDCDRRRRAHRRQAKLSRG